MKVFCTGASGYIGGSVAAHLVAAGHQVSGLVRSQEKADALRPFGIEPVMGTLDDAGVLSRAAKAADVVINAASADHKGAAVALLDALAGSGKPFIHTSGSSVIGTRSKGQRSDAVFDEDTPFTPSPARVPRAALNELILSYIDDLITLYALAIEKAPAGAFYFAENGENSMREVCVRSIACRVLSGRRRRCRWKRLPPNGARAQPRTRWLRTAACAQGARRELGWQPKARSLLEEIEHGCYRKQA